MLTWFQSWVSRVSSPRCDALRLIHSFSASFSVWLSGSSPSIRMSHFLACSSIDVRTPISMTFATLPPPTLTCPSL